MSNTPAWNVVHKLSDSYLYVPGSWCAHVFKKVPKWRSDLFCLEKKVFKLLFLKVFITLGILVVIKKIQKSSNTRQTADRGKAFSFAGFFNNFIKIRCLTENLHQNMMKKCTLWKIKHVLIWITMLFNQLLMPLSLPVTRRLHSTCFQCWVNSKTNSIYVKSKVNFKWKI